MRHHDFSQTVDRDQEVREPKALRYEGKPLHYAVTDLESCRSGRGCSNSRSRIWRRHYSDDACSVFVDNRCKPGTPPIDGLKDAFQNASEQVRRQIADPVSNIKQTFGQSVNRLLKTGEERATETRDVFQTWISEQTQLFEDTQRRFEERLRTVSSRMDDYRGLREQLDALQAEVKALKARVQVLETDASKDTDA